MIGETFMHLMVKTVVRVRTFSQKNQLYLYFAYIGTGNEFVH